MKKDDKQKFFDKTCELLAAQGRPAFARIETETCGYLSTDGTNCGCAVGVHLPLDFRKQLVLDGKNSHPLPMLCVVHDDVIREHLGFHYTDEDARDSSRFWSDLQGAHDFGLNLEDLKHRFRCVAKSHGLDDSAVEKFTVWARE